MFSGSMADSDVITIMGSNMAEHYPVAEAFEAWLVARISEASASGAFRAMCEQIFLEYRMARFQPELADWLAQGAPSDDAEPGVPAQDRSSPDQAERRGADRGRGERSHRPDRWHGTDDAAFACTCHLPQR